MKVLVVDDETMICEWLQFCISQNARCSLVGTAHNGREALEMFQKTDPDLILTDVKMPVMDGLELLHAVRSISSSVKVVMLTAFSDFGIVRQALREGASEYLLKAEMKNDVLQELLDRVANELAAMKQANEPNLADLSQAQSVISGILRKKEELNDDELRVLQQCQIRWRDNGLFALAVWKGSILNHRLSFPTETQARHVAGFDYTERVYMIVGNFPRALSSMEKRRQLNDYAAQVQRMNHCMVGISAITDEMRRIPFMVWQAACALAQGFYEEQQRLYQPIELSQLFGQQEQWEAALQKMRMQLHQVRQLHQYEMLRDFLSCCRAQRVLAVDDVCRLCEDAFDFIEFAAKEHGRGTESIKELRSRMQQCVSAREMQHMLDDVVHQCCSVMPAQGPKSQNIRLAVEYLHQHYAQPVSLEDVAARVYLNADYFSRAFKTETGQTFVNYLTDLRLQRSIHLLEHTALRVQVIAQQVGYYNASYFSTIFKKRYGMSPYEYRRRTAVQLF